MYSKTTETGPPKVRRLGKTLVQQHRAPVRRLRPREGKWPGNKRACVQAGNGFTSHGRQLWSYTAWGHGLLGPGMAEANQTSRGGEVGENTCAPSAGQDRRQGPDPGLHAEEGVTTRVSVEFTVQNGGALQSDGAMTDNYVGETGVTGPSRAEHNTRPPVREGRGGTEAGTRRELCDPCDCARDLGSSGIPITGF